MHFSVVTMAERPDLIEASDALGDVWPKYNNHGDVMNEWFWRVKEELPEFQLLFVEDDSGEVSRVDARCRFAGTARSPGSPMASMAH